MGRNRFVQPDTVRLDLSDGDWIEVKRELTVGEQRKVAASYLGKFNADGSRSPNMDALGLLGVVEYLVDWSFRDAADKPVPLTLDAVKNLRPEDFAEIEAAVDAHIVRQQQEADERKKARGGTAA